MKTSHLAMCAAAVIGVASTAVLFTQPATAQDQAGAPGPDQMAGLLMKGLKDTPGCLGVDACEWMSGKNTIAAWFESKEAVSKWYYNPMHQEMMKTFAGEIDRKPMAHVPDDVGPVMVLATLTPSATPAFEGLALPVSQISIELFKPLPGGAALGGRLAPDSFKVPKLRDYTPPTEPAAGE